MKGLVAGVIVVAILALILQVTGDDDAPDKTVEQSAKAATVRVAGSFERSARGDGMPVFSAVDVPDGAIVEGSVEIANRGRGSGYFILSQADLTDLPGPGGGALSRRLDMTVRDVTSRRKPVTLYRGPLNAMGARSAGFIEPGDRRRYRFTAQVSRPGDARRVAGVDDPYDDSATTVRYVWSAVDAEPPKPKQPPRTETQTQTETAPRTETETTPQTETAPPPPRTKTEAETGKQTQRKRRPPPPRKLGDRRPPILKTDFPRVQRLLDRDYLVSTISCNESCLVRTSGSVQVGRRRAATPRLITAPRPARTLEIRTRIPRSVLARMRRSLRAGRPATIRLTIQARDPAGNRSAVKRVVRLNPRIGG